MKKVPCKEKSCNLKTAELNIHGKIMKFDETISSQKTSCQ